MDTEPVGEECSVEVVDVDVALLLPLADVDVSEPLVADEAADFLELVDAAALCVVVDPPAGGPEVGFPEPDDEPPEPEPSSA